MIVYTTLRGASYGSRLPFWLKAVNHGVYDPPNQEDPLTGFRCFRKAMWGRR